jgi:predicted TIM-barrel fold metal-dependent hydrolase
MKRIFSIFICINVITSFANTQDNRSKVEKISIAQNSAINDHHVHIMSPQLIALWKEMGIPFAQEEQFYSDIDTILRATGAKSVSLVSMAYVYSSGEFGGGAKNAEEKTQSENDYIARAKLKYPKKIKAYYGIDPLSDFALSEIKRCHKKLKLDGIKLHHNASQVYLTEPEHLTKVKTIFQYASDNKIPVLMHFDNSHPKFGRADVKILADSVLINLDYVNLQIAHFGTSGGFSQKTKSVLESFIELFQSNHPVSKHKITFDISGVCLDKEAEGVAQLTENEFAELAVFCRKLGFNRIVFGTDYPLYRSTEYLDILKTKLKLTESELDKLLEDK